MITLDELHLARNVLWTMNRHLSVKVSRQRILGELFLLRGLQLCEQNQEEPITRIIWDTMNLYTNPIYWISVVYKWQMCIKVEGCDMILTLEEQSCELWHVRTF